MSDREHLHRRENGNTSRASMREKLIDKKKVNEEHESNFQSGRVNVRERYLHRTGIRGRKRYIFYCVIFLLGLICVINLIMLAIMLSVLQIDKDGMRSLSFFESGLLRWMRDSDLQYVHVNNGVIGNYKGDDSLDIETTNQKVIFHGGPYNVSSELHVGAGDTMIRGRKGFKFVDPYAMKTVLQFNGTKVLLLPEHISGRQVSADSFITHRVVSNEDQDLNFTSSASVTVSGNEGVYLDGKTLMLNTDGDVTILSTVENSIHVEAEGGVKLSETLPETLETDIGKEIMRFKLCICANTFQIYRVLSTSSLSTCKTTEKIC